MPVVLVEIPSVESLVEFVKLVPLTTLFVVPSTVCPLSWPPTFCRLEVVTDQFADIVSETVAV